MKRLARALLILIASGLAPAPARGQAQVPGAAIDGIAIDSVTRTPIRGALLNVVGRDLTVLTDQNGAFTLPALGAGRYVVQARAYGYVSVQIALTLPSPRRFLTLVLAPAPVALEGFDVRPADGTTVVRGVVRDVETGAGLLGASVAAPYATPKSRTVTDELGGFALSPVPTGSQMVLVEQLGYKSQLVSVSTAYGMPPLEFSLEPDHALLRGVQAIATRFRSGRDAIGRMPVRALDRSKLVLTPWTDLKDVLERDGDIDLVQCDGGRLSDLCFASGRGGAPPDVCIDGARSAGMEQLRTYRPRDLYLVEIYGGGRYIRAWTIEYMKQAGTRPNRLLIGCKDPELGF